MKGIYKIINPNNVIYIGQSIDLERRIRNYKKVSKDQTYLYNSIQKYGYENHKFEIIHELPNDISQEILNNYEILYWKLYKDCGFEMMNLKKPGSNYIYNENALKRKSESLKKNWESRKRKVYQYDKQGNFIREWKGISDISLILNLKDGNLFKCLNNEYGRKSVGGFVWSYSKLKKLRINIASINKDKTKVKILQYSKNNEFIKEWDSFYKASKELSINRAGIYSCIKGISQTAGNFIWKLKN